MSGNLALVLVLMVLVPMVYAGRRGWLEPRPAPREELPATFVLDTRGRVGASVLVNGTELNSVVGDITIEAIPGRMPSVVLRVVPSKDLLVKLEAADLTTDVSLIAEALEHIYGGRR